jgi:hypothetical protein
MPDKAAPIVQQSARNGAYRSAELTSKVLLK